MANISTTGNAILDNRLLQNLQRNFSMFNPTDAYASFTSQVANTPNWWESLARAATAPLFITGLKMYNKYTSPKKNGTITPEQQEQNRNNFNELQNNLIQSQDYWQKQRNIPENQRTYKTLFGADFGRGIYNNFYNPTMPTEFTVEQMWNTPRTGENIADYANRVNPAFDWRKSLLGNFNFNN